MVQISQNQISKIFTRKRVLELYKYVWGGEVVGTYILKHDSL